MSRELTKSEKRIIAHALKVTRILFDMAKDMSVDGDETHPSKLTELSDLFYSSAVVFVGANNDP